ncbi:MAG: GNAT family N-acetyltransferase [Alphaproteobacteria bacterium]|nr:GNAT family N-acetyltransferase [Alphaproteobacteria bacterium]MCB9700061.1 GNAT family N-acetyltransferase [Alphaproteobacteria bacterium]
MVRLFTPPEWSAYREIRLEALRTDPGVFSSDHGREQARPEDHWRARLADERVGIFGVQVDGAWVGMTGVVQSSENPDAAVLWGSWLRPEWRRRGLSVAMYVARFAWARGRGLTRVLVSHREGNTASASANQKHGFERVREELREWPDGAVEAEVHYVLDL